MSEGRPIIAVARQHEISLHTESDGVILIMQEGALSFDEPAEIRVHPSNLLGLIRALQALRSAGPEG